MNYYNFLNLSSFEFELLIRDLLQKKLNIDLESFTSGRDLGIDLRYSINFENNLIVQCKRIGKFDDLKNNLQKEVEKVKKIKPKRYIIATSVGLTPNQKIIIKNMFGHFIINNNDIIGKDEINNFLLQYKEVEKQHFKLWLSSTNVLESILHSNIINQTNFEKSMIENDIKTYAFNESYNEALKIIKENHFIIISGIPGIGKTTLAHVLVYYLLANNFEEFVVSSESIDESYKLFKEGKSQVFLYDDFLGKSLLDNPLQKNEDKRIINFVNNIKEVENKVLILTTREYILNQAFWKSELLSSKDFNIGKYVLDLSKYTRHVKARIFYNHLFFSSLPKPFIENIVDNKSYFEIIDHKNYNPRIIHQVTNEKSIWSSVEPKNFIKKIVDLLNYPEKIWKHAFENQISDLSRVILIIITLCGTPIFIEDILKASQNYLDKTLDNFKLYKSLKEIENTFIKIKPNNGHDIVDFFNPSVNDFLIYYIKNNIGIIYNYLKTSIFINEFFNIVTFKSSSKFDQRIIGTKELEIIVVDKLVSDFPKLTESKLEISIDNKLTKYVKTPPDLLSNLKLISNNIDLNKNASLRNKVADLFNRIDTHNLSGQNLTNFIDLIEDLNLFKKINIKKIFELIYCNLDGGDLLEFYRFEEYYPKEFNKFISTKEKRELIDKCFDYISYCSDEYLETYREDLESIANIYNIETDDAIEEVDNRISEFDEFLSAQVDDYSDGVIQKYDNQNDLAIGNMFDSLKA